MKQTRRMFKSAASAVLAVLLCAFSVPAPADTAAPVYEASELFSDRDLKQAADLTDAVYVTLTDGTDVNVTEAGVYVLSGTASDVTVRIEAADDDKVQIVLDGAAITNADFPCIYAVSADKVFVTASADSSLAVTGAFRRDGDTNTDGVIFSRCDLTLSGTAQVTIASTDNGVVCKDDLKVTGGTWTVRAASKALEANDSIRVADGTLALTAGTDGLHAENDDDDTKGFVFIGGGDLTINAGDDGIHASTVVQIDGGTVSVTAAEGIEGTVIRINGGDISVSARDDGVNAARKSSAMQPAVIVNGGSLSVSMGAGDTDGIDSNGDITINGGIVSVTGNSGFDYDGTGVINGGTVFVNGQQVSSLPNQFFGGMGGMGGWGGMNGAPEDQPGQGGWGGPGGMGGRGGRGGW